MKRGGPLKRTSGLARRTALKAKSALERGGTTLERKTTLKPVSDKRRENPRRPGYDYTLFVLRVCFERKGRAYVRKPCAVCGAPATDAHHVIPKQRIEQMALRLRLTVPEKVELLMDTRNGIALCAACHSNQESAFRRVPFGKLTINAIEFAGRLDTMLGTEECRVYLERTYPRR